MTSNRGTDKTALVVVMPETRAWELTFDSFQRNLLDVVNGDLCLCVKHSPLEALDNPFYQHAKHTFTYTEDVDWLDNDRWGDAFDFAQRTEGVHSNWRVLTAIQNTWLTHSEGGETKYLSPTITLFFRWYLRRQLVEQGLLDRYEWFVITRSDFFYPIPHVSLDLLDKNFVWVPDGQDFGGITDRHMIVSRDYVQKTLSVADPIIRSPDELFEEMREYTKWNMEQYLKLALDKAGILGRVKRFPYTMYTVKNQSTHTGWSQGFASRKYDYLIKYPSEYKTCYLAGLYLQNTDDWNRANIIKASNLIDADIRLEKFLRKPSNYRLIRFIKNKHALRLWLKIWRWSLEGGMKESIGRSCVASFILLARLRSQIFGPASSDI